MFNEWTVVMVIIAIVGLIGTVAVPLSKNTSAMTSLREKLDNLVKQLEDEKQALADMREKSAKKHGEIFGQLDEHEKTLTDHEHRIQNLEHK